MASVSKQNRWCCDPRTRTNGHSSAVGTTDGGDGLCPWAWHFRPVGVQLFLAEYKLGDALLRNKSSVTDCLSHIGSYHLQNNHKDQQPRIQLSWEAAPLSSAQGCLAAGSIWPAFPTREVGKAFSQLSSATSPAILHVCSCYTKLLLLHEERFSTSI